MTDELNCILTENEIKLCEFALTIADESFEGRDNVFRTLRDKLKKLGYEYK